ncbi:CinA family protein [Streptomyces albofaciens]|uniref:CinA family protein n=1 Tax=Streptomyces albofaciens TaxID=66866 RepID=UPI00123A76AC|nr:CinA family protein [Streptomyces albofaciens]
MIPAAARAVVRAAVETAQRDELLHCDDVAEQVVEELTAQGWTITLAESPTGPPAAA